MTTVLILGKANMTCWCSGKHCGWGTRGNSM